LISSSLTARSRYRTSPLEPFEIPNVMLRHNPGWSCNSDAEIIGETVSPEAKILLRRAFSDCLNVRLVSLTGGRSANVFMAYATFRDSVVGPRPLPFFVKIDEREKVAKECHHYNLYAEHFIPYHLRPFLHYDRCMIGAEVGILVGTFVEKSESLWDVARRGLAQQAIRSLFDDALWGWRSQAYRSDDNVHVGAIAGLLTPNIYEPQKTRPAYVEFAKRYDVHDAPQDLWDTLIKQRYQRCRVAPMHGDMHGNNVRVRGPDAIVIDLLTVQSGPLAADLAALDTWLAFELPADVNPDTDDDPAWRYTIDMLFAPSALKVAPRPPDEPTSFDWLHTSIRQIRVLAMPIQLCDTEYRTVVAVYLLRRTMYDGGSRADTFRRGYAYVIAARLVADIARELRPQP
jgi:hypothetical protein